MRFQPVDATEFSERLWELAGVRAPVVISDSFGRPWRNGIVNVAIGVSGLVPLLDLRGRPDAQGRLMRSTVPNAPSRLSLPPSDQWFRSG